MTQLAMGDRKLSLESDSVVVGEAVELEIRRAGYVQRAVSSTIDAAVMAVVMVGLAVFIGTMLEFSARAGNDIDDAMLSALIILALVTATIIVPATIETLTKGRSLGRWIMGLQIVRDDGGAVGFRHAFIRALLGILDFVMTSGGCAAVAGMLHPKCKRVGDMLAGTICQQVRERQLPMRELAVPPHLRRWAASADVSRLPDRSSRRILDYLDQFERLDPSSRQRMAESIGREVMPYVHPMPNTDADSFLRAVAAIRRDREFAALERRWQQQHRILPTITRLPHGFPDRG